MTSEQIYQLLFIVATAVAGLIGAYALKLRSDGTVRVTEANTEHEDTVTENYVTKRITDNYIENITENKTLYQRVSKAETKHVEDEAIIRELRKMVEEKNVQIETQSKFLRESAGQIKALQDLNDLQQAKIHEVESKLASYLDDGYKG